MDSLPRYRRFMQLQNNTVILAAVYVAAIGIAGLAAGITSAAAWVALTALALLPALSLLIVWSRPLPTPAPAQVVRR